MLKIGEKAPDFVLPSDEGEEVSLENFKREAHPDFLLSQSEYHGLNRRSVRVS